MGNTTILNYIWSRFRLFPFEAVYPSYLEVLIWVARGSREQTDCKRQKDLKIKKKEGGQIPSTGPLATNILLALLATIAIVLGKFLRRLQMAVRTTKTHHTENGNAEFGLIPLPVNLSSLYRIVRYMGLFKCAALVLRGRF